jgi:hypothetical protein
VGALALGPLHFEDAQESVSRRHGELGASALHASRGDFAAPLNFSGVALLVEVLRRLDSLDERLVAFRRRVERGDPQIDLAHLEA